MKKSILIALSIIIFTGCETENISYEVITPSDRIFSFKDLEEIGFKINKEYNVDGLEGATGAINGFWASDKDKKEYELRFYPSHSIAVRLGEPLAQEVTGLHGKIKKSEITWVEGARERRQITDSGNTENSNWNKVVPKHGNYAILGNIVMLCEGPEIISLEVCWKLISTLKKTASK